MALHEKETVVVSGEDRSSGSWIIGLVVLILLVLAFLYFGGLNMFGGTGAGVNVETPQTIEVQPSTTPQ